MASVRQSDINASSWRALLGFLSESDRAADAGHRYEQLRARLLAFFRWRGAAVPEELVDETLDRVARRLADDAIPDGVSPERYALGVARRVVLEDNRHAQRERRAREAAAQSLYAPSDAIERERHARALDRCLSKHASPEVDLFRRYHQAGRGRDRIAARAQLANVMKIAPAALRVRMHRVRKTLLDCVRSCLGERRGDAQTGAERSGSK